VYPQEFPLELAYVIPIFNFLKQCGTERRATDLFLEKFGHQPPSHE
jgi:hypothetical protein